MTRIAFLLAFVGLSLSVVANDLYVHKPDTTKDQALTLQMTQARMKFQNENYQGALRIYRELYKENPSHAMLNYRMGETFFMLEDYGKVVEHLKLLTGDEDKAMDMLFFYLGKSYQNVQDFENAKATYEKFVAVAKAKDVEALKVDIFLSQVSNAINLLANPVDVNIENMGSAINTEYVDAVPSITADKTQMIFTTRRPADKNAKRDQFTGDYYDDVYVSFRQDDGSWSVAQPIEGQINTEWHDANTSISPDGKTIFLYKNIKGETQSGDIYVSKLKEGKWSEPKLIPENKPEKFFKKIGFAFKTLFSGEKSINSSYFETSACVTADNNNIYFISERTKKGVGGGDVWTAHRVGRGWSVPKNLGKLINSSEDEIGVYIHPDGNTLFYSSKGSNSMGGYDIFMVKKEDGRWQEPVNLGYPINTPYDEYHFVLSADSKTAYISSNREGGMGAVDIYEIDMQSYFRDKGLEFAQPHLTVVKGTVVDEDQNPIVTEIIIKDAANGKLVTTVESDDSGKYLATLKNGHSYEFSIEYPGMKSVSTTLLIPEGEDAKDIKIWHFILSKE